MNDELNAAMKVMLLLQLLQLAWSVSLFCVRLLRAIECVCVGDANVVAVDD